MPSSLSPKQVEKMMGLFGANAASRTCAFLFQFRQGTAAPLVTPTAVHDHCHYHYHSRRRGLLPSNVVVVVVVAVIVVVVRSTLHTTT